jgi:hypothetical protein
MRLEAFISLAKLSRPGDLGRDLSFQSAKVGASDSAFAARGELWLLASIARFASSWHESRWQIAIKTRGGPGTGIGLCDKCHIRLDRICLKSAAKRFLLLCVASQTYEFAKNQIKRRGLKWRWRPALSRSL